MNWGIIGLDLIAEEFMEKLRELHRTYVVACEDQDQRQHFLKQNKAIKCYETIEELLQDPKVEVVYISTFLPQHQQQIVSSLSYGKHVFCEKPMFANAQDAKEAYQLAQQKGLFLGEANTIFYMPLHQKIKQQINQIGKLKMIRAEFGSLKAEDKKSFIYRKDMGGGALYDIGIYAITAVLTYLKGTITSMKYIEQPHPFGVDERWLILMETDAQELAEIMLSIRSKLDKRLILAGDLAYYEIMNYPRVDEAILVYPDMRNTMVHSGVSADAVRYEIEEVERCIQQQDRSNKTMNITIQAMECMDQLKGAGL